MDVRGLVLVFLVSSLVGVTSSQCGDRESVEVQGGRRQSDGSLVAGDGQRYPPGCFWNTSPNNISGCPGKVKPCVAKCCPGDQVRDENYQCVSSNNPLLNTLRPQPIGNFNTSYFDLVNANPCFLGAHIPEAKNDEYTILENASLFMRHADDEEELLYEAGHFCQEIVEENGTGGQIQYFACFRQEDFENVKERDVRYLVYSICCIISIPFLIATLVVYAVIPELRNLHGKCLMSHVASLTVAFVCLALIQLGIDLLSTDGCITAAMMFYYFFLASFFWLNVMCFDIWWTFSGYRTRLDPRDNQMFVYYSCYAWSAALVLLCVCATMQFADISDNYLRPQFGEMSCWFPDNRAKWAYFDGPIAAVLVCNVVFFTLTALSIWRIKKQTAVLTECKDSQKNAHTKKSEVQFKLFMKLFIVMGVSWTLETLSAVVGGPDWIWWAFDMANLLVGIPIFIIFVWKAKVKQLLMSRLNIRMGSSADTSGIELT